MGLFDFFRSKPIPQDDMLISSAIDAKQLSEEKMRQDLEKLNEFNNRLAAKKATLQVSLEDMKPEEAALRMKNPFRGE